MILSAYLFALILSASASAHEGHHHGEVAAKQAPAPANVQAIYRGINRDYEGSVKPIFDQKCAACHSLASEAPWYAKVPGVGWIVENDRREAKEHLEISKGFPFAGHGSIEEDFEAIQQSVTENTMPTLLYKLVHPASRLTDEEKTAVLAWVERSKETLATVPKEERRK